MTGAEEREVGRREGNDAGRKEGRNEGKSATEGRVGRDKERPERT